MNIRSYLLAGSAILPILFTSPSWAYYETKDSPEFVKIEANQSAFAIPIFDGGDKQTVYGSKTFLDNNKVAQKLFKIPHTKISNPNWGTYDYFVPSVNLIIVDRTPYMKEWRDEANKGTSSKSEGFDFQSAEGINIETGISISAFVTEENASTFLYWFGTRPSSSDPANPASQFTTVSYGKSLGDIMDTVVRGYVQSELSNNFMKCSFTDCNKNAGSIMEAIKKNIIAHFAEKGITIDYIGYSGPLNYSQSIQNSIDTVFISTQTALASAAKMPAVPYMQAEADINVRNAESQAITRWNGQLPNLPSWIIGTDFINSILNWVGFTSTPINKNISSK